MLENPFLFHHTQDEGCDSFVLDVDVISANFVITHGLSVILADVGLSMIGCL